MRYKALPLSARSGRSNEPSTQPQPPGRRTAADWLSTAVMVLLVPALVLPFAFASAAEPELRLAGAAVVDRPLGVQGHNLPARIWVQFTWDGEAKGMPRVRTAKDGSLEAAVTPPTAGAHVLAAASEQDKGRPSERGPSTTIVEITVSVEAGTPEPTPEPTPTAAPTVEPTVEPTANPTVEPTAEPTAAPTGTATAMPTPTVTAGPTPAPSGGSTPGDGSQSPLAGDGIFFGVFEDSGSYWTSPSRFSDLIDDVRAHNLDSAAWTNGYTVDNLRLAEIADQRSFPMVSSWMQADLARSWWPDSVPATIDTARAVLGPLVDQLKTHSSIIGYNLKDDATTYFDTKFALAEQVIRERDVRPSSPMLVRGTGGASVYAATQGDVFLFYDYPARIDKAPCSWTSFWVNELRVTKSTKPADVPVWQVLQAHSTQTGANDTDTSHLRYPTVEEMRLQTWIALGEGAKGLWWFTYTSGGEPWIGLRDNPTLYSEVSDLGRRLTPLKPTLGQLSKQPDAYTAAGGYVSTMKGAAGTYVIVSNTSCSPTSLRISGSGSGLRDVETGALYSMGSSIPFRGGDGRLFLVSP